MTLKEVQQTYDQARSLLAQKKYAEADACCLRIEALEQDHAGNRFLRGMIALETGKAQEAVALLERANELSPNNPEYLAFLAKAWVLSARKDAAREAATAALELNPGKALTLDTLGVVFSHLNDHRQAAAAFQAAVTLQPGNVNYLHNLGTSLKFTGDFDAAEDAFQRALTIDPGLCKTHFALAYLRKQTPEQNHIAALEKTMTAFNGSPKDRMQLGYALAKEQDDLANYPAAWSTLNKINSEWNKHSGYRPEQDRDIIEQLKNTFNSALIDSAPAGFDSAEPIFIIGLPRSGTTLTDRILSSHSSVTTAGELSNFGLLAKRYAGTASKQRLDPKTIRRMATANLAKLGSDYIDSTRPLSGKTPYFTDKLPFNFLYAGLIMLALPNAKIICLRRNPMDSCLGNFRQLFTSGHSFYGYSYDILNCGRYYLLFDEIMRHWNSLFPERIFNLQYEELVESQAQKTRELLNYCGLDWEDQCLSFEKNTAPVATASSAQVREPINRKGLARWKNYATELQPLRNFFRDKGIEV